MSRFALLAALALTTAASAQDAWETYVATAYCSCTKCCGKNAMGITFTGHRLKPGSRVIAVDPTVLALRSLVEIDGMGKFMALDTGSAIKGRRIDIWFEDHQEALVFGKKPVRVRVARQVSRKDADAVADSLIRTRSEPAVAAVVEPAPVAVRETVTARVKPVGEEETPRRRTRSTTAKLASGVWAWSLVPLVFVGGLLTVRGRSARTEK